MVRVSSTLRAMPSTQPKRELIQEFEPADVLVRDGFLVAHQPDPLLPVVMGLKPSAEVRSAFDRHLLEAIRRDHGRSVPWAEEPV